jgi:para-aminobenzoate synthetase/4-amino-4-deoxychorismate lyase
MPPSLPALMKSHAPFVLLEDRLADTPGVRLYHDPVEIIRCDETGDIAGRLRDIKDGLQRGLHAAGFLSYELGYGFEPRLTALIPRERSLPLFWFGLFREALSLDAAALDREFAAMPPPPPISTITTWLSAEAHAAKVQRVLDYLAAGDAYQINLTFPLDFRYDGDPLALYAALRASQPVSHGGLVAFEDATILSVSPELFVEVEAGYARARPMKGTAPRHADPAVDLAAKTALRADPKQRAENLMIVDLLRNDLGRISTIGSVEVPSLFDIETYPTLHTLTSTITARLEQGTSLETMLRALFPCGSITGAPKVRAMEIIRELEGRPRGVYTGSIGAIAPGRDWRFHDLKFNVAIRTATIFPDGAGHYGIGGGIVADSKAGNEYAEALLKGRVLSDLAEDYGLIETLRWSPATGFVRLSRHLDRLARSAAALSFRFDRAGAGAQLATLALQFGADGDRRIRLELRRSGEIKIAAPVLTESPDRLLDAVVAAEKLDAGDPFLRHKTTRRERYETALAAAARQGADEAIFLNRDGYITEATRSNFFLDRDGILLTPPLSDGVLPGVLRQELIDSGAAIERQLVIEDLVGAGRWWLGNSLRGLMPARLRI